MDTLPRLAGLSAAHGLYSVYPSDLLIPFVSLETKAGERELERLVSDDPEQAVQGARELLQRVSTGATAAVLVYDGTFESDSNTVEALFVEGLGYSEPAWGFTMVIPFRAETDGETFAIYQPFLAEVDGAEPDPEQLTSGFFDGIAEHPKGAELWAQFFERRE